MRRLAKPSLTWVTALIVLLGVIGVAVAFAVRDWPSGTLDAATVLAKSQAAEAEILAKATEGTVLHYGTEEYLRQGPAAPLVQELRKNDFYVPESVRTEGWSEVGPSGRIARVYGRMTDENGRLVQEVTTEGNEAVTRAAASGAEERWPLDWSVEDMTADVAGHARQLEQEMGADAVRIVGYGDRDGNKTVILELNRVEEPEPPEPDVRGYTLPYTLDLDSVERVMREEVDAGTFFPYRWWMVAVDSAGQEHLVWDIQTVVYEVLEPGAVPPEVFGGR
jgi:hypothetical protein